MAKKKDNYLSSDELKVELLKLKDTVSDENKYGTISEQLGIYFLKLVSGLGNKGNFSGYTYLEEMKGQALEYLIKYSHNYNPNHTNKAGKTVNSNPFAYCTQIAYFGFVQYLNREKKIAVTKEAMYEKIINQGEMLDMNVLAEDVFDYLDKEIDKENEISFMIIDDLLEEYYELTSKLRELLNEKKRFSSVEEYEEIR